ncbi:3662_t:CDS:2, partial [Gigaspora margarita]
TSGNNNFLQRDGQDGKIASLSTGLGYYNMERHISTMNILHKSASKEKFQGTNCIFGENEYGANKIADVRYEQIGVKDESENDAVECSNREKIRELQLSLRKLLRDSTLDGSVWTKEHVQTPCYLVLPNNEFKIEHDISFVCQVSVCAGLDIKTSRNNSPIIVEQISESDGSCAATSLHLKLQTEDPKKNSMKELQCYIKKIKQFGFNHIIIIGKRYCGMLFMDCFGRVFYWDSANDVLWLLGDYFEIISKDESEEYGRIAWGVLDDGTVIVLNE